MRCPSDEQIENNDSTNDETKKRSTGSKLDKKFVRKGKEMLDWLVI